MHDRSVSKPERIRSVIDRKVGRVTKKEIMEWCPDISKVTVERAVRACATTIEQMHSLQDLQHGDRILNDQTKLV